MVINKRGKQFNQNVILDCGLFQSLSHIIMLIREIFPNQSAICNKCDWLGVWHGYCDLAAYNTKLTSTLVWSINIKYGEWQSGFLTRNFNTLPFWDCASECHLWCSYVRIYFWCFWVVLCMDCSTPSGHMPIEIQIGWRDQMDELWFGNLNFCYYYKICLSFLLLW